MLLEDFKEWKTPSVSWDLIGYCTHSNFRAGGYLKLLRLVFVGVRAYDSCCIKKPSAKFINLSLLLKFSYFEFLSL